MSEIATDPTTIELWKATRGDELDAEAICALAVEVHRAKKELFERIAADERRHADHWAARLRGRGSIRGPPTLQRARILCRLAGDFGDTVVDADHAGSRLLSTEAYLGESGVFIRDEERHARYARRPRRRDAESRSGEQRASGGVGRPEGTRFARRCSA